MLDLGFNLSAQIRCVERELAKRRAVYKRLIEKGTMTERKAEEEIGAMQAVLRTLVEIDEKDASSRGG